MHQLAAQDDLLAQIESPFPMEFAARGTRSAWKEYVRTLEASHRLAYVPAGEELVARRVYIDLYQPCRGPIRALQGQVAGTRNRYLAQEKVPAELWSHIIEHCACVDRATGAFTPSDALPSLRSTNPQFIAA